MQRALAGNVASTAAYGHECMANPASPYPPGAPQRARRVALACFCRLAVLLALVLAAMPQPLAAAASPKVFIIDLDGAVGPVSAGYVVRGLKRAADEGASLAVLRLDTPGGLDSSMREIVRAILASPVPVAGYVAPGGARAASAGTFILYACQIAAMAPGTNLGAASPVSLFGSFSSKPSKSGKPVPGDTEARKVMNDAVAYIRGLARLNGRNADWAEEAVRTAASLPADEALKMNVIDLVADNVQQLLARIDGRTVTISGSQQTLKLAGARIVRLAPGLRTRLLLIFTNPNVAYLLLLVGVWGLIFEFSHPGIFAPGVTGAIALFLGFAALSIIPVNLAGLALTLLGLGLMVAEAFMPSFGALGLGGIAAFVLGSMLTFDTPGYRLAWPVVLGATVVSVGLLVLVLAMLVRARRRPAATGDPGLIGAAGKVVAWSGGEGEVLALGERWHARADTALSAGQSVRVVAREGLTLKVEAP